MQNGYRLQWYGIFPPFLIQYLAQLGLLCIAQGNNIKTSYYVQRMTEHYFPLKIPITSNTIMGFSPEKQPRGTDGPVPAK